MSIQKTNKIKRKIQSHFLPTVMATALVVVALLLFAGNKIFHSSFMQDFSSNFLSTILGVIIGIPIALWTASYQERSSEQMRKAKILSLLQEELLANLTPLSDWQKTFIDHKFPKILVLGGFLRDESWRSFSDGGELQWVKDPTILSQLSWAYGSIRTVRYLLEKYESYGNQAEGVYGSIGLHHIRDTLDTAIDESCEQIKKALKVIS
jgi:hypothetical protein